MNTKEKMPNEVWCNFEGHWSNYDDSDFRHTLSLKYIYENHALALVAAEREANAGIADEWCRRMEETGLNHPEDSDSRDRCFARACQAMYIAEATRARTDADAQAALEARDKRVREKALREALPVTSALAAAISLLDRARLQAPSDKMFEQMVLDYQRALDDFRAALQTDTDKP